MGLGENSAQGLMPLSATTLKFMVSLKHLLGSLRTAQLPIPDLFRGQTLLRRPLGGKIRSCDGMRLAMDGWKEPLYGSLKRSVIWHSLNHSLPLSLPTATLLSILSALLWRTHTISLGNTTGVTFSNFSLFWLLGFFLVRLPTLHCAGLP